MRIGEIAEKTGLTLSNIRFYEKKGLIGPDRDLESQYRNYSEDDLEKLKLIILYRKMDLSIETIADLLAGTTTLENAIKLQLEELEAKKASIQGAIDLCQKIAEDGNLDNSNTDYYLSYVKEEESKGIVFGQLDELLEDISYATKFEQFIRGSFIGRWLLPGTKQHRIAVILWTVLLFSIPVIGVISDFIEGDGVRPSMLIVLILWWGFLFASFAALKKGK